MREDGLTHKAEVVYHLFDDVRFLTKVVPRRRTLAVNDAREDVLWFEVSFLERYLGKGSPASLVRARDTEEHLL